MNHRKFTTAAFTTLLLAASCTTSAATVSYVLDQSNALPDNVDYLKVTISDNVEGQLDFWVDILSPLKDIAGENFGIQKFAFNIAGDVLSGTIPHYGWKGDEPPGQEGKEWHGNDVASEHREYGQSVANRQGDEGGKGEGQFCRLDNVLMSGNFILPDGWELQAGNGGHKGEDGFNVRLQGNGNNRQDPLHFTVLGLELEDILAGFSAHVAGFDFMGGECASVEGEQEGQEGEYGCKRITSAHLFGGHTAVVPLPAAISLFGSGLLGIAGVARRRGRKL